MAWIKIIDQKIFKPVLLKFIIGEMPSKYIADVKFIESNEYSKTLEANDLFFVEDVNDNPWHSIPIFAIWFFITLILYMASLDFYFTLYTSPLLILALWQLALHYFNPTKEVVLDRLNGTITYPKLFFYKTPNTFLFSEIQFFKKLERGDEDTDSYRILYLKHPKSRKKIILSSHDNDLYEEMYFYIWYMDKNRPLPPGNAFDPYRKDDFDRRHKEGFLAPLYPSLIDIKEANSSQEKIKSDFLKP